MAKFRPRLTTLRKLREIRRDELQAKLAEAIQATQMLEEQIKVVGNELDELQNVQRMAVTGSADVNSLLETQRFRAVLQAQRTNMKNQATLLNAEIERRRQAVVEADKDVRLLEKFNERERLKHLKNVQRADVKELDEIASSRQEVTDTWQH